MCLSDICGHFDVKDLYFQDLTSWKTTLVLSQEVKLISPTQMLLSYEQGKKTNLKVKLVINGQQFNQSFPSTKAFTKPRDLGSGCFWVAEYVVVPGEGRGAL